MFTDSGKSVKSADEDDSFDPTNTTGSEIEAFVKVWKKSAEESKIWNKNLWYTFQQDFAKFTLNHFKELPRNMRMMLRTFLYTGGVYVSPYNNRRSIGDTLYECANLEAPHKWTQEDVRAFDDEQETAVSPWLAKCVDDLNRHPTLHHSPRQTNPAILSPMYPTIPDLTNRPKDPAFPALTSISPLPPAPQPQNRADSTPEEYYPQGYINTAYGLPRQQAYHTPPEHAPNKAPHDPPNTTGVSPYSKELTLLDKIYPDSHKYDGFHGAFGHKLSIFYHYCNRKGIPSVAFLEAFPTMLKGVALDHFLSYQLTDTNLTFGRACKYMHGFFEGPEWQRKQIVKWQDMNLYQVMNEHPDSSTSDCLRILVSKLLTLQHSLPYEMRNTKMLHDKVIMACENVPACGYGVAGQPDSVT